MRSTTITTLGLAVLGFIGSASAESTSAIFVAGYDGSVRTVNLKEQNGKFSLTEVNKTDGCKTNPTWLSLEAEQQRLWCLDEGWVTGNGSINTFDVEEGGVLRHTQRRSVSAGPVQSKFLNRGSKLAVAQFGGPPDQGIRGGLTVHDISENGTMTGPVHNLTFDALATPGPKPGQDVPRGHGVTLDPSGKWMVITDYGADKLRTYSIANDGTFSLGVEMETPAGSAPRHAVFSRGCGGPKGTHPYLFVLSENANTVTTYNVSYKNDVLQLSTPSRVIDTFGGNATQETLDKAKAGEIQITRDNRFIVVTNRLDESFPGSDSIATYRINTDGSLTFVQLAPVGGISPRHFAVNRAGDKVLVSITKTSKIAVLSRDKVTGKIGEALATLDIDTKPAAGGEAAGIPAAIWYE